MQDQSYWGTIKRGIQSSLKGLQISLRHLKDSTRRRKPIYVDDPNYFEQDTGMVTLRYPYEAIPVPDNGRYRLHNEMDDCIVCDKCAKVCPVDCIEIEPIRATGEVGKASDGSAIRLFAAKFDIDMAKCCYCGLCTTVCPTECLTMTKTYDYSEFDIRDMVYHFTNLTPEKAEEKKQLYEQFVAEKEAAKTSKPVVAKEKETQPTARPAFKPGLKKTTEDATPEVQAERSEEAKPARPAFKPGFKKTAEPTEPESTEPNEAKPARPVFKPGFKKTTEEPAVQPEATEEDRPARPAFKPGFKKPTTEPTESEPTEEAKPARPAFKPGFKKTPVEAKAPEEIPEKTETPAEPEDEKTDEF
ncbi:hypothetical protein BWI97_11615 [Siphonobacter sp. BAB-5405]|uniref:4Fe-4S binding protein n=1 Tax=Siphonobacter sp. BAB-5405 TaxID=1864825 RepID=UPI000C807F31|nr:4Fe-4S binding protein [Siphonobacter sp. BAB-5405]PMD96446.1 hypothetical protein BWI97_11615 [Siphonobacter sp. BAB-5405]